jgi:CRISPR/Cas system endoribonuclease Cas6 (RAMP superfamily)
MPKNELFEQIVNQQQSSNKKLNENDNDDDNAFLYKIHNKLIYLFNLLYEETGEPEEWARIVHDALNNSDISDQELDALRNSFID